jgi:predicted HTH domain antitoxin
MTTVTIEIPDDLIEGFNDLKQVQRVVLEDFVIEQRQCGKISLGRAAELLGTSYIEFFDLLGKKGLSFANATPREIEDGQHELEKLLARKRG